MKRSLATVAVMASCAIGLVTRAGPAAAAGEGFQPATPLRVLDTRANRITAKPLTPITLTLAAPSGASGVSVNVTVTESSASGWASIHPCDQLPGLTSTVNFEAGVTIANAAPFTSLESGVCVTSLVETHLVVDVTGWWIAGAPALVAGTPLRVLDTRSGGGGRLVARQPRQVASGTSTGMTLIVTEAVSGGWGAVHPCGQVPGQTSTVNFTTGQTVANLAFVPNSGPVCITTSVAAHAIVDLVAGPATGTTLSAVDPRRILDTRDQAAWVAAGAIVRLEFGSVRSVALNVTAVRPLGPGFVTVWPCSQSAPVVSQMSWSSPRTVATAVLAAADQGGSVCLRPSVGTHLLIDLLATDAAVGAVQTSVSARTNEWLLGHSVRGRPIMARAFGNPEGVPIVGVGVIHGNEESGIPIVTQLKPMSPPSNVAMWLVDSVNPDGQAAQTRGNVNGVDLNRNYPTNWQPIARTNNYSGTAAGSEPETRAMLAFLDVVRPHLGVWWHTVGDYADDSRSAMEQPELLEIYVARASIGIDDAPCLGFCGGTATQHANRTIDGGSHFVVELPSPITTAAVGRHAAAFMAAAAATR